jgi:glutamine cyclotransferase
MPVKLDLEMGGSRSKSTVIRQVPSHRYRHQQRRPLAWRLPFLTTIAALSIFGFFAWVNVLDHRRQRQHIESTTATETISSTTTSARSPTVYTFEIVKEYPHDPAAFTQGLQFDHYCPPSTSTSTNSTTNCRDVFWESTGNYGQSTVREVDVTTGQVLRSQPLPRSDFGEGLTRLGDSLYQITWMTPKMWVYSVSNFNKTILKQTPLKDGWGITTDGQSLIMGDSTETLYYLHPDSMKVTKSIRVTDDGKPIVWLNELEWIDGEIWANIYQTPCIARIDPVSGTVTGWVVMSGLKDKMLRDMDVQAIDAQQQRNSRGPDVLNGIAWDERKRRLFVTGKWWPKMYELKVTPQGDNNSNGNGKSDGAMSLDNVRKMCSMHPNIKLG